MTSARSAQLGLLTTLAVSLLWLTSCGSGEREFSPAEMVEELNSNGASLALGPVLTTTESGFDVNTLTLTEAAPSATGGGKVPVDVHGAATMIAFDDSDQANAEFTRCEGAPILTCFRAANVVIRFEGLPAADEARIVAAMQALEGGEG